MFKKKNNYNKNSWFHFFSGFETTAQGVLLTGGHSDVTKNGNGLMTKGTMMNHLYNLQLDSM